jgi:hypothetical protein
MVEWKGSAECPGAASPSPARPTRRRLRKDQCDNRRRMIRVCRLSVFATRCHGRRPLNLFVVKMSPSDVNGLPSGTCPPRLFRRPRTTLSAYKPNARRQTLRHSHSLKATRHADTASIPATTAPSDAASVRSQSTTCLLWTFRPPRTNTRNNMHDDKPSSASV